MFKNKKLIIFDMDGTLLDSAPSLAYAVNYMLRQMGKEELSLERIRQFIGKGSAVLALKAYLNRDDAVLGDIDAAEFEKAHKIFLDFYGKNLNAKTRLYPGVPQTLKELKKRGYTLALVTNKPHQFVFPMLEYFGLANLLEDYLGTTEKFAKKPAPDMLLHTCKKFGLSPKEAVMVGDSQNDIFAAKNANMDCVGVSYGYFKGDIESLNPTAVCNSFNELLELF